MKKKEKFKINDNDMKSLMRVFKLSSKLDNYGYNYVFSHSDIDDLYFIFNNYILLLERVKKYGEVEKQY